MHIKLWGVRGSLPTPMSADDYREGVVRILDRAKKRWEKQPSLDSGEVFNKLPEELKRPIGGNTTCLEVAHDNTLLIFDMGSGARRLGIDLLKKKFSGDIHVLITHTHWDHIQGWPFFVPGFIPGNKIHFYSAFSDLEKRLVEQQEFQFFPVGFNEMASKKEFHHFKNPEEFNIGPFTIQTHALHHPGGSTAYRIQAGGKTLIFATDTEFYGENLKKDIAGADAFFHGADILLMDAQYTFEEASTKVGWGHTSARVAIECAIAWDVKKIILTHHEPAYNDQKIHELHKKEIKEMKSQIKEKKLSVVTAYEEMEIEI